MTDDTVALVEVIGSFVLGVPMVVLYLLSSENKKASRIRRAFENILEAIDDAW